MTRIFKIIEVQEPESGNRGKGVRIGLDMRIGDRGIDVPLSTICYSEEAFLAEGQAIRSDLERVLAEAKTYFEGAEPETGLRITPEMSPKEIWGILSQIENESSFVKGFNSLDETRRKEIAEHVLTECNVFSGKASIFSARYDSETGFMG